MASRQRRNATRLCQVFVNILINAAQAIVDGTPEENEVRVRAALDGDHVVVTVRDSGVGIPAEVRGRIEPADGRGTIVRVALPVYAR